MFTTTTATISISPVQIFVGGVALGAGAYVGHKACVKLEEVASKGVNKLREKMKKETATVK